MVVVNHLMYPVFWIPALKCNARIPRKREREREQFSYPRVNICDWWTFIFYNVEMWSSYCRADPHQSMGNICLLKPIFYWRPLNRRNFPNPFNTAEQRSDPATKANQSIPCLKKLLFSPLVSLKTTGGKEKPKCVVIKEWNISTDERQVRGADPNARVENILLNGN